MPRSNFKKNIYVGGSTYLIFLLSVMAFSTVLAARPAKAAQPVDFPQKNITWIVPFGPGGGYDTYSRAVAKVMPKYLPKNIDIIIRNIPGAGTMKATLILNRSKPDGYTLGILDIQALSCLKAIGKSKIDPCTFQRMAQAFNKSRRVFVPHDGW